MSAWDNGTANLDGISAYNSSTDNSKIQELYALSVPPIIDYGELPLNTESAEKIENVTNLGNMDIDLELYGYGGTAAVDAAQGILLQAQLMQADAEALIKDAEAKLQEAYALDPSLKPKKGPGRPKKTA